MGKASHRKGGEECTKAGTADRGKPDQTPYLPVEILGIVAEHLIGQHAFGTAASLNRISRKVHHETLPVLYETLFLDRPQRESGWDPRSGYARALPLWAPGGGWEKVPGLKHTKYIFYITEKDDPLGKTEKEEPFSGLRHVPNVVLTIPIRQRARDREGDACRIHVHRPVSMATMVKIAETPVHQPIAFHISCFGQFCQRAARHPGLMDEIERDTDRIGSGNDPNCLIEGYNPDCRLDVKRPRLRPADAIGNVYLHGGAYLHSKSPVHLQPFTAGVSSWNCSLLADESQANNTDAAEAMTTTVVEMLRLSCCQRDFNDLLRKEILAMRELDRTFKPEAVCAYRKMYTKWHLDLNLGLDAVKLLVDKLDHEAVHLPTIFQSRLHITIPETIELEDLHRVMDRFREIYTRDPASLSRLPTKGCCAHVVEIDATCKVFSLNTQSINVGGRPKVREAKYNGVLYHDHHTKKGKMEVVAEVCEQKGDGRQ